jgi:hypothetical protein
MMGILHSNTSGLLSTVYVELPAPFEISSLAYQCDFESRKSGESQEKVEGASSRSSLLRHQAIDSAWIAVTVFGIVI